MNEKLRTTGTYIRRHARYILQNSLFLAAITAGTYETVFRQNRDIRAIQREFSQISDTLQQFQQTQCPDGRETRKVECTIFGGK